MLPRPGGALITSSTEERAWVRRWCRAYFAAQSRRRPFSFAFGGRRSEDLLRSWPLQRSTRPLDRHRTAITLVWTDPVTGLAVRCKASAYRDSPTVEWTLHFRNSGTADTPIIEQIQALDMRLRRAPRAEFQLHHSAGSPASRSDYAPLETALGPGALKRLSAAGGRSTNSDSPTSTWRGARTG
jgi:alpha-galactosidase